MIAILRMRHPGIRQFVDCIQFFCFQWMGRRINPKLHLSMALNQRSRITWVGFDVQDSRGVSIVDRVFLNRLETWESDIRSIPILRRKISNKTHHLDILQSIFARDGFIRFGTHRIWVFWCIQTPRLVDVSGINFDPIGGCALDLNRCPPNVTHFTQRLA